MTPNKKCVEEAIKIFTHGSGASKNPVDSFLVAKDMLKQLGKAYLSGELGVMASEEEIIASLFKWDGKVMRMERMREIADALVGKIASVGRVEELEAKKSEYRAALEKIDQFNAESDLARMTKAMEKVLAFSSGRVNSIYTIAKQALELGE